MVSFLNREETKNSGYKLIFGYLMLFVAFIGAITLLPLLMMIFYRDEWMCWPAFFFPGAFALLIGGSLGVFLMRGSTTGRLGKHQDSVLLVAIWLAAVIIGAFPFFLADKLDFYGANNGTISMSFSESFFEAMSGYSATGFTVMSGLRGGAPQLANFLDDGVPKYCPHIFLFYRAITQFFGGVGLVLVVSSAVSDRFGMKLFYTEGHNDRLLPNLAKTAKATFGMYALIIFLGTLFMWFFGMDLFEALCHSIAGMATGGFTTRVNGFYGYSNPHPLFGAVLPVGIELSCIVIMLLGATSFLLLYNALTLKWKNFLRDLEVRFAATFIAILTILCAICIVYQYDDGKTPIGFGNSLRYALFQIVSSITTTGFGNAPSIVILGHGAILLSIIAMLVGGGMGSTAGAIKQYRVAIQLKSLWWSIKYKLSPSRLHHPHNYFRAGKNHELTEETYREASLYTILYIIVVLVMSLLLIFFPNWNDGPGAYFTVEEAFYLVTSALSGTGSSIVDFLGLKQSLLLHGGEGLVWTYNFILWIMSLCMIMGRLEIMPLYYGAMRLTRDVLRKETI